jgi:hypothetical protein
MCGNKNIIDLLEEAKSAQLSEFPEHSEGITGTELLHSTSLTYKQILHIA